MEKYLETLNELVVCENFLARIIPNEMMFLDGEIVDKKTFETIREATNEEIESFYNIRLLELRLKELIK